MVPPDAPFDALIVTLASGEIVTIPLALDTNGISPLSGSLHISYENPQNMQVPEGMFGERLRDVRSVAVRKKADAAEFAGTIGVGIYEFSSLPQIDGPFWPLSWSISVPKDSKSAVLFEMEPTVSMQGLIDHLRDNRLYYSQAIWRALDPATIGILLSGYTWPLDGKAKPLVEFVDPNPVAIIANYLVLRISGDDESEHTAWLDKKKIKVGSRREDQVPVPSGGVFAEAVLGRFNSAEKLDITRFWNWQDSPIPIQAPDIAAIQAGSRRDPDNTVPGQLSAPVLNIVNPPSLPDPQGMGAILAAIQNGNMFRDMSGLAATIGLAQAGLAGAQQGATDAAAQAGKNAEVAAQFGAKLAETAAKVVAAYFTGGASLAGGGGVEGMAGGISGQGAKINQGEKLDQKRNAKDAGGSNGAGNGSSGGAGGSGDGGSGPADGVGGTGSTTWALGSDSGSHEVDAFNRSLGGGRTLLTSADAGFVPDADTSSSAWPKLDPRLVISRLKKLQGNANLFDQGGIGLCPAAAFYHHMIQKNPIGFGLFAKELHAQGMGYLNNLKIAPEDSLRNVDYNALAKTHGNMPPQADWMLMAALRDSRNLFIDFDGAPDEKVAFRTTAKESSEWYTGTGYYSSVSYSDDDTLEGIKKVVKTTNNHVALVISLSLLNDPRSSHHMITLESPMIINEAANSVKFDYWTWGQPVKTLSTTVDSLKDGYKGAIIARF